jgi:GrpB-like predicted nucleotidyltransferase (UPF0157 family)
MVEKDFEHWDRLLFRDYLIGHSAVARKYEALKLNLAREYRDDRILYTQAKTEFIERITEIAKRYFSRKNY